MMVTPTATEPPTGTTRWPRMSTTMDPEDWDENIGSLFAEVLGSFGALMAIWALQLVAPTIYLVYRWTLEYTLTCLGPLLLSVQGEQQRQLLIMTGKSTRDEKVADGAASQTPQMQDVLAQHNNKPGSDAAADKTGQIRRSGTSENESMPLPSSPPVLQQPIAPTMSSLFSRLWSTRGLFRGLLRGIWFKLLHSTAHYVCMVVFIMIYPFSQPAPFVTHELAGLFATLATCHILTAWVHYCISMGHRHAVRAWIPPYWHTVRATWRAHLLRAAVAATTRFLIRVIEQNYNLGVPIDDSWRKLHAKTHRFDEAWWEQWGKHLALIAISITIFEVPRAITIGILYRVHASMLAEEDTTIVPLDRAFGAQDAKKRGYVTMMESCGSLGRAFWKRLGWFYVQIAVMYIGAAALYLGVSPIVNGRLEEWEAIFTEKVEKVFSMEVLN